MAYIYKIENDINHKIYIGKTYKTIQKRFQEHCHDASRNNKKHRPLYAAMNKYGIEHFHISLVEETDIPEEREKYWIEFFGSFKYGYNATLGGDGKPYIDYDLVISTYRQLKNQKKTAEQLNISVDTVRNVLQNANEYIYSTKENYGINVSKIVYMFDLQNNFLRVFPSLYEAATYMVDNKLTNCKHSTIRTHISEVCHKRRKTAAGFIWKFDNIE